MKTRSNYTYIAIKLIGPANIQAHDPGTSMRTEKLARTMHATKVFRRLGKIPRTPVPTPPTAPPSSSCESRHIFSVGLLLLPLLYFTIIFRYSLLLDYSTFKSKYMVETL